MGRIISSYIFPHPPLIIPEVGKGAESGASRTVEAVRRAAEDIKADRPSTIIVTTPHGPVFQDYIYISVSEKLTGDFGKFGGGSVRLSFENNIDLVNRIIRHAKEEGIFAGGVEDRDRKSTRLNSSHT